MRKAPPGLETHITPAVAALGYELVGIEYLRDGSHGVLRVYIDSEDGITLDDCERVSHQVSGILDVEDLIHEHYVLEVSSPGLNRPLFTAAQFIRFIGHDVKIRLSIPVNGRRNFKGKLCDADEQKVQVEVDGEVYELPVDKIDKANLVPQL